MQIVFKDSFVQRLEDQVYYISLDSIVRATKFQEELLSAIKKIPSNPNKYRKSIYFNDDKIRDLIFKGYTIVFRINENQIEVFGLANYQKSPVD